MHLSVIESTIAASLKRAARLRQSVLKEAFAGRLVPQDPADEPASALLDRIRRSREKTADDATPFARSNRGRRTRPPLERE